MKRTLIMILALSMVALLAMPAFAEVQNIKVTGSVVVRGFYRDTYGTVGSGSGASFATNSFTSAYGSRDWYNTQTQLGVSADLTDNVAASILLANERDWMGTATTTAQKTVTLQNAYITVREMLYSPLTVKIGKMPVSIADKLVIGDGNTANNSLNGSDYEDDKSFDAIVGTLDYEPLTLALGTIKNTDGAVTTNDDSDIYFINGIYKFEDDMNTVVDISLINTRWTTPDGAATGPASSSTRSTNYNTFAAVLNSEPIDALSAKLTVAMQKGDYQKTAAVSRDLEAMAIDLFLDYAFENDYSPKVGLKYVYRSGEEAGNAGDFEGWQAAYEDQSNGIIYDPNSNISAIAITASAMPADRLTLSAAYWMYALDEAQTAVAGVNTNDDEAGQELDLMAKYAYTEDVSMGLELAWFFPGNYYASGNDKTAEQVMLEFGVKF